MYREPENFMDAEKASELYEPRYAPAPKESEIPAGCLELPERVRRDIKDVINATDRAIEESRCREKEMLERYGLTCWDDLWKILG